MWHAESATAARFHAALFAVLLLFASTAHAGLYYSGESFAELPSQWRGFLLDQRALRMIAAVPGPMTEASPLRLKYQEEAKKLEAKRANESLTALESADLGALYVRLGDAARAVEILRGAQREHPNHFYIHANLGSAWQAQGEYSQAVAALEQSAKLAPGKLAQVEEYHLKLARSRLKHKDRRLDDLFGVRFGSGERYEPGKMDDAERKKLPAKALAILQQLALWFPSDGPVLWQLAELANAEGDVRPAANLMEGCITQFGMNNPELRRHRDILKEAAEKLPKVKIGDMTGHAEEHPSKIAFRSRRPLLSRFLALPLPPISDTGVNHVPWDVFAETQVEGSFKPRFSQYLQDLDKKQVALSGFMYPLRDDLELSGFMFLESPVGCWYCEMPDTASIVYVELEKGTTTQFQRTFMRVVGTLMLNRTDPEDFFYTLKKARVTGID
jgi:hypothetical protein